MIQSSSPATELASSTELYTPSLVKFCASCSGGKMFNCISPDWINAHFSPVDCCNINSNDPDFVSVCVCFATSNQYSGGSGLINQLSFVSVAHILPIFMLKRWQNVCNVNRLARTGKVKAGLMIASIICHPCIINVGSDIRYIILYWIYILKWC